MERMRVRDKVDSDHQPVEVWIRGGYREEEGKRRNKEEKEEMG